MSVSVLGLSAWYHDAAAALIVDGRVVAAAQEERFSRIKNDDSFPRQAIEFCLSQAKIKIEDLDYVGFYEKPILKFDRILETHLSCAPRTFSQFRRGLPKWLGRKLFLHRELNNHFERRFQRAFVFTEHHESHAAAAFFPSPFEQAAILTVDGVGEWSTTTVGVGKQNKIRLHQELRFPHSLGLLYSAFTQWAGFEVNTGEYMLMGLAPYGEPIYEKRIREHLVHVADDGSFRLNMQFFDWLGGTSMISSAFERLFECRARQPQDPIEQRHKDVAASIQRVTEDILLRLAHTAARTTGAKYLCVGGGCALNSVAIGRIRREGPFERVWVQPAAGDAGSALGVAFFIWHQLLDKPREIVARDAQDASLLGPRYEMDSIRHAVAKHGFCAHEYDEATLTAQIARLLDEGRVLGLLQGRMEFGPRALGSRSIIADPRIADMKDTINRKIKFRELFRPFAPSILQDHVARLFDCTDHEDLPYMTHVVPVRSEGASSLPATTHVDGSARIQTVDAARHGLYFQIIQAFQARTHCPAVLNTSFNVRGEPIVCTPEDALRCFARTDLDALIMESCILVREEQPLGVLDAMVRQESPNVRRPSPLERFFRPEDAHPTLGRRLQLGLLIFVLSVVAGGGYFRVSGELRDMIVSVGVGITFFLATLVPLFGRNMYRVWMALGVLLGNLVGPVVLGLVYLLVFTPIAWIRKLRGHDPLDLRYDPKAKSYFSDKLVPDDKRQYLRLY